MEKLIQDSPDLAGENHSIENRDIKKSLHIEQEDPHPFHCQLQELWCGDLFLILPPLASFIGSELEVFSGIMRMTTKQVIGLKSVQKDLQKRTFRCIEEECYDPNPITLQ